MILFTVLMFIYRLIFFYVYKNPQLPFTGSAFILGFRFDLRYVSILGLFLFFVSSINLFNPFIYLGAKKFWNVFLCIIFLASLIFYISDFYHYDYLKQRLNASVLNFAEDARISMGMMTESYPVYKILFLILIFVFLFYLSLKFIFKSSHCSFKRKWPVIVFIFICAFFIFGNAGQYPLRWSDAYRFGNEFKAAVALNPFQSFLSTLKFRSSAIDISKVKSYYKLMSNFLNVPNADENKLNFTRKFEYTDSLSDPPNVVLVICESYSMYKSSMAGNALNPSPFFNSLTSKGLFFNHCFTPSFGTARGVWATITGIPDVERPKTASRNPLAVDQHTIINDFKNYDKFYFLGGSTTWANIRGLLTNNIAGIKIFEEGSFKSKSEDVWGISDKNLFLEATSILEKNKKPFFAVIQTAGNHRPYTIPEEDLKEFKIENYSEKELNDNGYDNNDELNAFRYMDFSIKKFMEAVSKTSFYNNTLFVFVGDHGIAGNAKGLMPENYTKYNLLAEHVPLLFYGEKFLKSKTIKNVCSQIDILPTIASLCRQNHTNTTLGRNLLDSSLNLHYAFIADPDKNSIGVVSNANYFIKYFSGETKFVSLNEAEKDDGEMYMQNLTDAFWQTSKYLLLNNKK